VLFLLRPTGINVIVVYVKHLAVQTDSNRDGSDDWGTQHTVSKREISSTETLHRVNDFIRHLDGSRRSNFNKIIFELLFRDDDDGTLVSLAVSRLVGRDDFDSVETPNCQWILDADIGALLVAAVKCEELADKNSVARKKEYVRGRFKHQSTTRMQVSSEHVSDTRTSLLQQTALPAPRFRTRTF
jgi:hypothetical protein